MRFNQPLLIFLLLLFYVNEYNLYVYKVIIITRNIQQIMEIKIILNKIYVFISYTISLIIKVLILNAYIVLAHEVFK